jgi:hypothetical protein
MGVQPRATRKVTTQLNERGKNPSTTTAKASSKPSVSVCDDLTVRIATRAYELYATRSYGDGYALDDWVQAEREVLSQS